MEPAPRAPVAGAPVAETRNTRAPLLSGSSPKTSPVFVPVMSTRLPFGNVLRIGEFPMSRSGPLGLGHASPRVGRLQPPYKHIVFVRLIGPQKFSGVDVHGHHAVRGFG